MLTHPRIPALLASLALAGLCKGEPAQAQAGGLRVCGLRCEFATDPMGVDAAQPRLSWRIESAERGEGQAAWQVLASTSLAALNGDRGDLWDSGRVASDITLVPFGGARLVSSQRVFWKIRAWDASGRPSGWSPSASWTMGILASGDWRGDWIAAPWNSESLFLRGEFTVKRGLCRAVACCCGLGQYELYLNGSKAGADLLSPGWTRYDRTTLYDTRDVTSLLREGRNAAGFILGNGMYDVVRRDRYVKFAGFQGPLRAILHLRLEYGDGSVEFFGTDAAWRSLPGPITTGNIYSGEDYDARLEPRGWSAPGFNDGGWMGAVLVQCGETLRGQGEGSEPLRGFEAHEPVSVRRFVDGTAVYDFGQNASHMPRLRVSGPAGSVVRLTPAEVANDDGTINRNTMDGKNRGSAWWQYTKATDQEETWFPRFYYVGCRFMKVQCFASQADLPAQVPAEDSTHRSVVGAALGPADLARLPRIESIEAVVVHADAAPVGRFETSNGLLNCIRVLVRWAQCSNMVSVLTDCPHREKLGWLEQYHLNGPAIRYEFDTSRIFTKGMHDMADAQTSDGLIPDIAPEYVKFDGAFRDAAEWGSAFIIVPWQQYEFTGDRELLREYYPRMKRYFAYLESRASDDVIGDGLGDWFDLGPKSPGYAQNTPPPVTASAFYFYDALTLSRIAAVLGMEGESRDFGAMATRIRASYNRHFFHGDGSYATGSQCANALALVMGIVEEPDRANVLANLVADVERRGYSMTTGDIGFRYLLQALAGGGRSDVIYRMINQDDRPGYGYQIRMGATSLTESWDANLNSSHNHFMLGQITEWFYRDLAGIDVDPEGPGFKRILLHPCPVGDLAWVDASYESIHGPIAVRWERGGGAFRCRVSIPACTTATLYLPARAAADVKEGGRPAAQSQDVAFLRQEGDRSVFALNSGRYVFESKW